MNFKPTNTESGHEVRLLKSKDVFESFDIDYFEQKSTITVNII